jgi:LmbE family N-acetylglucosaminyl deacetylase
MAERVLIIAPHPDDEAIGCGGMICLHRQRGDPVHVVFLTSGEHGIDGMAEDAVRTIREAEAREAAQVLEVDEIGFLRLPDHGLWGALERGVSQLAQILRQKVPQLLYLPHPEDAHPDHQAALPLVQAAAASLADPVARPELRAYEIWSPMIRHDWTEDISAVLGRKLRAIRCYRSQLRTFRYDRAVRGLNQYRGVMAAGSRYAEAFGYLAWQSPPGEGSKKQAQRFASKLAPACPGFLPP